MKTFTMGYPVGGIILCAFSLSSIFMGFFVFSYSKLFAFILILMGIYALTDIIYRVFLRKIQITEEGVRAYSFFYKYELKWDEVKTIGITGIYGASRAPWIYFSKEEKYINSIPLNFKINENIFFMYYRKSAINEIKKYYSNDIINMYKGTEIL